MGDILFTLLIIWIFVGGIWAIFGPYNWNEPRKNKLITNILILPATILGVLLYNIVNISFEIFDWAVHKYYELKRKK